jgi:DNA mismatch repair protein MutL
MLLESGELLRHLGWDLAPLGPPTVVIQGVPSELKVEHPAVMLQDLLDGIGDGGLPHLHHGGPALAQDDVLERLARSHACHAAVKAGDVLSVESMRALVNRLFGTDRPHGDPHGRPTFVRMELDELHRRFGRT